MLINVSFVCIRLIELNKLKISTRKQEAELLIKNNGVDPDISSKTAAYSLGGVIVKTFQVSIYTESELIAKFNFIQRFALFAKRSFAAAHLAVSSCTKILK